MKTVVLSGGTGSIALKTSLSKFIPKEELFTIVNAYDNGLSTGMVRKVYNGDILGPSDVRKQQFLDYSLYRDQVKDYDSEAIYDILNERYTIFNNPKDTIYKYIKNLPEEIKEAVNHYFNQPLSTKIRYNDFSLANIVYAGLAAMNNNSLQAAANIMADYLNLPKNIILNDDASLFLCAETESGYKIYDEAEIVKWNNINNRIQDIFFITKNGKKTSPLLSELAKKTIQNADLLIASAGTQFSSLIPTYKSIGFDEAVKDKKVHLVTNVMTDKDMTGYTLEDQIKIVLKNIKADVLYIDNNYNVNLHNKIIKNNYNFMGKHNGDLLVKDILTEHYNIKKVPEFVYSDYDDTLLSRNYNEAEFSLNVISEFNKLPNKVLVTGKSIKEINYVNPDLYFCNYGNTIYNSSKDLLENRNIIPQIHQDKIINILSDINFNFSNYENRADTIISLRFLEKDYRNVLYKYLKLVLLDIKEIHVIKSGKSTIDIMKTNINKYDNIKNYIKNKDVLYIGDEPDGNDKSIMNNVKSIHVKSIYDTYTILKFLNSLKEEK